tara:strand:- start:1993 stop:2685 length:693 start_codon:yes stop_codon:yes gene_type:complete
MGFIDPVTGNTLVTQDTLKQVVIPATIADNSTVNWTLAGTATQAVGAEASRIQMLKGTFANGGIISTNCIMNAANFRTGWSLLPVTKMICETIVSFDVAISQDFGATVCGFNSNATRLDEGSAGSHPCASIEVANAQTFQAVCKKDTSAATTDTITVADPTLRNTFKVEIDLVLGEVNFYVNGTLESTIDSANIPNGQMQTCGVGFSSNNANPGAMYLWYSKQWLEMEIP